MPNQKMEWSKATCPICGKKYEYLKSYKPATCGKFHCIYEHQHKVARGKAKTPEPKDNATSTAVYCTDCSHFIHTQYSDLSMLIVEPPQCKLGLTLPEIDQVCNHKTTK